MSEEKQEYLVDQPKKDWYSPKDLFEMIQSLKLELVTTTQEMRQTRQIIGKYNGLREEIEQCKDEIQEIKNKEKGKMDFGKSIREWGGWLIALVSLILVLLSRG